MAYRITYGGASTRLLEAYLRGLGDGWLVVLDLTGGPTVAGYLDGWVGDDLVIGVVDPRTSQRTGRTEHVRVHTIESLTVP